MTAATAAAASGQSEHSRNDNYQQRKKLNPLSHQKSPVGVIL
jgi:hypothetical protein